MNAIHNRLCSSGWWAQRVEQKLLPFGIDGLDLGDDVLEIGPGFGATTRLLVDRVPRLRVLELDPGYCERLRAELDLDVDQGDATALPYEDGRFSAVVCFTMLHHIPVARDQDRVFAEVARVLRPGGIFAGTDSIGTGLVFKLIHVGDTLLPIDPDGLPARLSAAGLTDAQVARANHSFRFRAIRPAAS
jgi:ubiquinone/menaquinone biosynthesis C-methylase UbiE